MSSDYLSITYPQGGGIRIYDSVTMNSQLYFFYSKREAIQRHRRTFGLVGKHLRILD